MPGLRFQLLENPGRQFEIAEMEELLAKRTVGPLENFRNQRGRTFSAMVRMDDDLKISFDFGQADPARAGPADFSGQEPLGKCPKMPERRVCQRLAFIFASRRGAAACDFRTGAHHPQKAHRAGAGQKTARHRPAPT